VSHIRKEWRNCFPQEDSRVTLRSRRSVLPLPAGGERNGARISRQGIDENVKTVTGFSSFQGIHLELDAQIPHSQQDTDKSKAHGLAYKVHL